MYIAQRRVFGCQPRDDMSFSDIEVKDGRVTGTVRWDNEKGFSKFNVKLQSGARFYRGTGSGKICYYLKEVTE